MNTFEWLPTECADERYPMQLVFGRMYAGDDFIPMALSKVVNNGWGEIGSRRVVGEAKKPVPESVTVAWFSYAEDQFFGGDIELPHDKLTELFRTGLRQPGSGTTVSWSKIMVGMGLGGWASVWLAGSGIVREVTRTRLPLEELEWARVLDNPEIERADYVRERLKARVSSAELQDLAKHGPPAAKWPSYSNIYRWKLVVEGLHVPLSMYMRNFNGERNYYDFARTPPGELELAPKNLQITWQARRQRKHLTKIAFNERELLELFDQMCVPDLDAPPVLRVKYSGRMQVSITLERGKTTHTLSRAEVKVTSLTSP